MSSITAMSSGATRPGWVWVACPLCGSESSELVFETRNRLFGTDERASLRRCACGFCMTNPQPRGEALARCYESNEYYTHKAGRSVKERARALAQRLQMRGPLSSVRLWLEGSTEMARFTSRFVPRRFTLARGARLLDFGCGSGEVAAACAALGLQVVGVEPDPKARAAAESLGVKVAAGLDGLGDQGGTFDRIILRHVLEHVPDPVGTLRDLGARLARGGRMLVAVPNVESFQARVFGEAWIGYDMPRHLWHFSSKTLERAAGKVGLRSLGVSTVELAAFASASLANVDPERRGAVMKQSWSAREVEKRGEGTELVGVFGKEEAA